MIQFRDPPTDMLSANMKHRAKCLLGTSIEAFIPRIAREIDSGRSTGKMVRLKNWVVYSRLARARREGNTASISAAHFDYWKSDVGNAFYDQYTTRFNDWFLNHHKVIVTEMCKAMASSPEFERLVEIGCGNGQVLEYCKENLPGLREVVGLDINRMIIERNRASDGAGQGILYVHGNAEDWLRSNPRAGTAVLTYGGVLEYFSEQAIENLLALLAESCPALLALVEPIDPLADLEAQESSYTFGQEKSFSHHHRKIFLKTGYEIAFQKEILLGGVRWMLMIGTRLA